MSIKPSIARTVLSLSFMVAGLALAMDVYVPAVPNMAKLFHVSAGEMQLTLSMFMVASGFMQLVIGPISDHWGRRLSAYLSISIFALGTVLCSLSPSAEWLILFRIIQAIGACGMLVIGFAIVRDLYHGVKSGKVYSYLNGVIAFSPMFAPFIGSYLDVHFGWQATFYSLLVIALAAFIGMHFFMPETLPREKRVPFSWNIFRIYTQISKNSIFSFYTVATGIGLSYLFIFCSISPYIIIRLLHIPELDYGYYFAFMGISFFVGSFLSGQLVTRIGIYKTVFIGFWVTLLGGIIMTSWYFITGLTINNFIWPMLLIGIGGTFCMGAGNGGAMEPFDENTGAAAALSGSFRFLFSAALGMIVITDKVSSTLPLAVPAVLFSLIGIVTMRVLRKTIDFNF